MKDNSSTSLLQNISQTIRFFRVKKGLSQENLAQLAELDRTYISGVERGTRNLTINSLERIIYALGISCDAFFDALKTKGEENEV